MKIDLASLDLGHLELLARQQVEGFITGLHKSPYHGFSVEFSEHAPYNTHDSTRHIDWKVYARTDKLYVKRFEEETNLRCHIIIDNSASMHYPKVSKDKIKFSILSAASLIYLLQKQRDAVSLISFADRIQLFTEVKSTALHRHLLFQSLEQMFHHPDGLATTALPQVIHEIAGKIHRRSLVILFTDMLQDPSKVEEIFSALQHLKYQKNEVMIFQVLDHKTEVSFDFDDRPHRFIDLETGQSVKLTPSAYKEMYHKQMIEYKNLLNQKAGSFKIDLIEADINHGVAPILSSYLLKRRKMS